MKIKMILLGTGTSIGTPMIGCNCVVCLSTDDKNKRLRTGAALHLENGRTILIDAPTDIRMQALRFGLERVDAVLITHHHADHIFGLDDLRVFNYLQRSDIPVYVPENSYDEVTRVFGYVFRNRNENASTAPKIDFIRINKDPIDIFDLSVLPVPLFHGELKIFGYRVGNMAYLTDVSSIPETSLALLENLDILVLSVLRYKPLFNHLTVKQAVEYAAEIGAERTYLVHMGHQIDYNKLLAELPDFIRPAYDGLELEFEV